MEITSIAITKTENNKRQLADVSIVFDYSLLIRTIRYLSAIRSRKLINP